MVQCVGSRLLLCHCGVVFLWPGRYAGCCARDTTPPNPKGQQPASRRTGHSVPTSRAPMQKGVTDLWSHPLSDSVDRVGSGLSIHARASPETEPSRTTSPRVYKTPWSPRPLQGNQPPCLQKPLEPETTAGQPAPVSAKAPGTRDYCRTTGPRVYKSSLTWIH